MNAELKKLRDLTDRILSSKEEKIAECVSNTLIVVDSDGIIKFANKKLLELVGLSINEIVGRHYKEFTASHFGIEHSDYT